MHPEIHAIIPLGLIRQLVNIHVEIPIRAYTRGIRPEDPRIADKAMDLQVRRVVVVDGVVGGHEHVDAAVVVAFEAVGLAAALAEPGDVVAGGLFGEGVGGRGEEVGGGDAVEGLARQRAVVDVGAVRGDLDAVEAFLLVGEGGAGVAVVEGVALVGGDGAWDAEDGGVLG